MNPSGELPEIELLDKRIEFVELLEGDPLHKPEIVERLDHSRSTVDRAISDLTEAGFVERVTEGFVTTPTGRLATERYRAFRSETASILAARDVLAALPPDADPPTSLLTNGESHPVAGSYELLEALVSTLDGATTYRALLPRVVDSRHLRLWHARAVGGDLTVSLVGRPSLVDRLCAEFPVLLDELSGTDSFSLTQNETPPYGLVLVERDGDPDRVFLLAYDDGLAGYLTSTDREAVRWAERTIESIRADGTEATDRLTASADDVTTTALVDGRLPPQLRDEGFVELDDAYVDGRDSLDLTSSYRVGLGFPEVAEGQSVDRYVSADDGEESLTDALVNRLRDGQDVAVVGPPGSGKSCLCKRVAHTWFDDDIGAVLYREGGDRFESTAALERVVECAASPTLVVVEDAVRRDANAVFELVETFDGREDAVFLLDARETEWQQPLDGRTAPRLEAIRHDAVETVPMPPLDDRECRRLLDRFQEDADTSIDVPASELIEWAGDRYRQESDTTPAAIYLVCHRLARLADPLGAYESTSIPTTLEADVKRVTEALRGRGPDALDVAAYVAVADAAGCPITPATLDALVVGDVVDRETLDRTREYLDGRVLFRTGNGRRFRGPHESWSARFLETYLDEVGADRAGKRVGQSLSALLALADDGERREALARAGSDNDPLLGRIVRDPDGWATAIAERLFDVGRTYATLAPLFGDNETAIELPDACEPGTELRALSVRGRMYETRGDLDVAADLFEHLERAASEFTDPLRRQYRLESLLGRAAVARQQGRLDDAEGHAANALTVAEDEDAVARGHLERAKTAIERGSLEAADDALDDCSAALDGFEVPQLAAELATQRGIVARTRSEYAAARDAFERGLERYRAVGDRNGESSVRGYLGQVANERGELDQAREQFRRGLELARDAGARAVEADHLKNLAILSYLQDDYEQADAYIEQGLPLAEAIDDPSVVLTLLVNGGAIDVERERFDRARERGEHILEVAEETGHRRHSAAASRMLAIVATETDHPDSARSHATEALSTAREIGATRIEIDGLQFLSESDLLAGSTESARRRASEAVEIAREIDNPRKVGEALASLGRARRRLGELDAARAAAEESRTIHSEAGVSAEAASREVLAAIALDRGDLETAARHAERAVAINREDEDRRGRALALVLQARVCRRDGRLDAAEDAVEEALSIVRGSPFRLPLVRAFVERAAIAREREAFEAASRRLEAAQETRSFPFESARLAAESARLARETEATGEALERFASAIERYESVGSDHLAAAVRQERDDLQARLESSTDAGSRRLQED
ncbi:MAG: tetratricopeptide repeat protein [Halapricum sp.]